MGNVSRRMFTTDITSWKKWCEENHLSMQAIHTAGIGAGRRNRTADLVVTNHSLYRLSYTSRWWAFGESNPVPSSYELDALT